MRCFAEILEVFKIERDEMQDFILQQEEETYGNMLAQVLCSISTIFHFSCIFHNNLFLFDRLQLVAVNSKSSVPIMYISRYQQCWGMYEPISERRDVCRKLERRSYYKAVKDPEMLIH